MVKEISKLIRASLPSTIDLAHEINVAVGDDVVLADPTQIHQILMNLCTNSGHAMREKGGVLKIQLSRVFWGALDPGKPHDLEPVEYLQLSISDTGHGIEKHIADRIFEPYFTTKGVGEGTGLGLSVVHGIVKSMGGTVKVYSEPEVGTVFHVFMPRLIEKGIEESETPPNPFRPERHTSSWWMMKKDLLAAGCCFWKAWATKWKLPQTVLRRWRCSVRTRTGLIC